MKRIIKEKDDPVLSQPRIVMQLHITGRCNLRCRHCYRDDMACAHDDLTTEDIETIIEQYTALKWQFAMRSHTERRGHVNITGGEPFIREDMPEILEMLAKRNREFGFGILTNGTLIDDEKIRWLKRAGVSFVQLSLDGCAETHDALRAPGNYEATMNTARRLENSGIKTYISFTANALNYSEFPRLAKECRRNGITRLWTDRIVPIGHGGESDGLEITPELMPQYLNYLKKAQGGLKERILYPRTEVRLNRALQFMCGGTRYRCGAANGLIIVDEHGTVMPCRRMPIECGNFRKNTLGEIYYYHPVFQKLRFSPIPKECEPCEEKFGCFGGARCQSYARFGDFDHADPACPMIRKMDGGIKG